MLQKSPLLVQLVLALYVAYGALGIAGLVLSIRQERLVFVQLVPAVSNTIHLIALSSAGLLISDWNPYLVDPKRLYLPVDFFMAAFGGISFYLLSTDDISSDSYFHIAVASIFIVLLGTVLCVHKSMMLLDLKTIFWITQVTQNHSSGSATTSRKK